MVKRKKSSLRKIIGGSRQTTGGFTTVTGESVLVTPSGEAVADAELPSVLESIGRGGGGSEPLRPEVTTVTRPVRPSESVPVTRPIPGTNIKSGFLTSSPFARDFIVEEDIGSSGRVVEKRVVKKDLPTREKVREESAKMQEAAITGFLTPAPEVDRSFRNLFGLGEDITARQELLTTRAQRDDINIFEGAQRLVLPFAGAAVGFGKVFTDTAGTFKDIKSTGGAIIADPQGSFLAFRQETRRQAQADPISFLGGVGANILIFKSPTLIKRGVIKGTDVVRTRGLTKLNVEDVVAPEIALGQTFPTIKKGQTAIDLLKEFRKEGAGVTSSPNPFKPITQAGRGSSEFAGVFQASKVSPHFLQLTSQEEKLFTFNLFGETLRPTVIKTKPQSFELVPDIRLSSPSGGFVKGKPVTPEARRLVEFFETEGGRSGKSFIPFAKTEKESIIPFGTQLRQTDKRFFFEFEGRRIPIFEFETVPKGAKTPKGTPEIPKLPTIEDISRSLSSSRVGKKGRFTPLDVSLRSGLPRSSDFKISSSLTPRSGRRGGGSSSSFRGFSRRDFFGGSSLRGFGGSSTGGGGGSSGRGLPASSQSFARSLANFAPVLPPISKKRARRRLQGGLFEDPQLLNFDRTFKRIPSFASVELGIVAQKNVKLERTGLFERRLQRPLRQTKIKVGSLGPVKIKRRSLRKNKSKKKK